MDANDLIEDLGRILGPVGLDADAIRAGIERHRRAAERKADNARRHNERVCWEAVGKAIHIRTGPHTTIYGVIETAKVAADGRAFEVSIIQSGVYLQGPYRVKALPR